MNTGDTFGEWTVIEDHGTKMLCKCSCGVVREVSKYDLINGRSKSCGHLTNTAIDLVGKKFGRWSVLEYKGKRQWLCRCDCGFEKVLDGGKLRNGYTKSCKRCARLNDLSGMQLGDWSVLKYLGDRKYLCRCSCGVERVIAAGDLKSGHSTSCGHATTGFKDISGQTFGDLTAVKYLGDDSWECKCSCGRVYITSGRRLRQGTSNSCGCKTSINRLQTMLERYGEVSSSKLENPRSIEQIQALQGRDYLLDFIEDRFIEKPYVYELCIELGVKPSRLLHKIHEFELEDYVDIGSTISNIENELRVFIESTYDGQVVYNDRTVLNGHELDVYLPDAKLAIEMNGDLWHSSASITKDKLYHQSKTIQCAKQGIQLIHIFEHEWNNKLTREKIKEVIKSALGISDDKEIIYARNLVIKEISQLESDEILNRYHIQNSCKSHIRIGAYFKDKIIGVITFGKPRFNSDYTYEIYRLCWDAHYIVAGGLERLFSYFKSNYEFESVITYVDISKFTGNSYAKIGFKADESCITTPNYVWYGLRHRDILTRYETQKHKLKELGFIQDNETEEECMERMMYVKIYDSGNLKMVYHNV